MATCGKNPFAKMNKRVALQSVTQTGDGQGGFTESWATVASVWASIEPVKGWEKMQAMQMQTPVTHNVTVRYDSRIATAKRLLYGSRVFEIKECLNDMEESVMLKLKCLELA
jgi:SPP1 family predicted phage head-tail adaptor